MVKFSILMMLKRSYLGIDWKEVLRLRKMYVLFSARKSNATIGIMPYTLTSSSLRLKESISAKQMLQRSNDNPPFPNLHLLYVILQK